MHKIIPLLCFIGSMIIVSAIDMKRFLIFVSLLAISFPFTAAAELYIKDGDSFILDGVEMRLWGIDAPVLHQSCKRDSKKYLCGREARAYLTNVLQEDPECNQVDTDHYDRSVVRCLFKGKDLNAQIVRAGWAWIGLDIRKEASQMNKKVQK